jgi:hypothetical protein
LPESYNIIVKNKDWWHLSSPIDPLNWSKSSFSLMKENINEIINFIN